MHGAIRAMNEARFVTACRSKFFAPDISFRKIPASRHLPNPLLKNSIWIACELITPPWQARHIIIYIPIRDAATQRPVQWHFDCLLPEEGQRILLARDARLNSADAFGLPAW
jgi:hypothetical protein